MDCPFFEYPLVSQAAKATNFKFGRVHDDANKSHLKVLEKRERGRIQGLPKFFQYPRKFISRRFGSAPYHIRPIGSTIG